METRRDLKVNGYMKIPGGAFNEVRVNGGVELGTELDCVSLEVNGLVTINGKVKTQSGRIRGKAWIKGDLDAADFESLGKTDLEGSAKVKKISVEGSTEVKGNITADEIRVYGEFKSRGNCDSEEFSSVGRFKIDGLLNADKIEIELHGDSYASEIGGGHITVSRGPRGRRWARRHRHHGHGFGRLFRHFFGAFILMEGKLKAGTIEGDDIYLEYTEAEIVRGNNVEIGEGCKIGLVEYKDDFRQDRSSDIGQCKRV